MIQAALFLCILICSVCENWFREVERFNSDILTGRRAGVRWHIAQLIAVCMTFIYVYVDKYGFSDIRCYTTLLLLGAIWYICYDGALNTLRGLPFFRISTQSTDPFQNFGKPIIKIGLFLIALIIFILYH